MIQVRKSTYRGAPGWIVSGYPTKERTGWPVSVFFEHETAARRYAALVKEGRSPDCLEIDWTP
jgi:hypothetical protein